jgi:hypothetical protein
VKVEELGQRVKKNQKSDKQTVLTRQHDSDHGEETMTRNPVQLSTDDSGGYQTFNEEQSGDRNANQ